MSKASPHVETDIESFAAQPLESLMRSAWDIRVNSFGFDIQWVNPVRTTVLSVTGTTCALNCAHCGGKYLRHMLPIERREELDSAKVSSCLVSGGCDPSGRVPVERYTHLLPELSSKWRLNMHLGLVSEDTVRGLAPFCDVVSLDFLVDDATIRDVYGFPASGEDFIHTYSMLRKHVRVVPHICIGLHEGRISGELDALAALAEMGADAIVFIVLIPTPGTHYENCTPPPVESVVRIIATSRCLFPEIPIYLGCMRPHGPYRRELDPMAVRAGVNRIVIPTREGRAEALRLGLNASWIEECCAL